MDSPVIIWKALIPFFLEFSSAIAAWVPVMCWYHLLLYEILWDTEVRTQETLTWGAHANLWIVAPATVNALLLNVEWVVKSEGNEVLDRIAIKGCSPNALDSGSIIRTLHSQWVDYFVVSTIGSYNRRGLLCFWYPGWSLVSTAPNRNFNCCSWSRGFESLVFTKGCLALPSALWINMLFGFNMQTYPAHWFRNSQGLREEGVGEHILIFFLCVMSCSLELML